MERGPAMTIVIVFVGLLLILNSLAGWIFSYTIKSLPSPFPSTAWYGSKHLSPHISTRHPAIFSAGLRHLFFGGIGIHVNKVKMGSSLQRLEKWPMASLLIKRGDPLP
jgi:hypothetical protein